MGASHSNHLSSSRDTKGRSLHHKRSAILSKINLVCTSDTSSDGSEHSHETAKLVTNEKYILVDHHYQPPSPPPSVAYLPSETHLKNEGEVAYAQFVKEYPGMSLLLDSLFETYSVDVRIPVDMDSRYSPAN